MTIDNHLGWLKHKERLEEQAAIALASGRISQEEHDYLLAQEEARLQPQPEAVIARESPRHPGTWTLIAAILLIASVIGASFFFGGFGDSITGQIVWEPKTFNETQTIPLNITTIASLKITGTLRDGAGTVHLSTSRGEHLVYAGDTSRRVTTGRAIYAINETITLLTDATNYTVWLDSSGNKTPLQEPIQLTEVGAHTIEILISEDGQVTKETVAVTITEAGSAEPRVFAEDFVEVCEETCLVNEEGPYELIVTMSENAELIVTEVIVTEPETNIAPVQTGVIPDQELVVGETAVLDLSAYFFDTEELVYDINNIIGVEETIDDGVLSLTGVAAGEYEATIYVSDLLTLTQATFDITITGNANTSSEVVPEDNQTTNATTETNNETQTNTTPPVVPPPAINVSVNNTVRTDCNDPDPNKRPLECIQNETNYFVEQEILLEDIDRRVVGKFTPVGNLLITGDYVEFSSATPGARDYSIGYLDGFGDYVQTIWIDSNSGDLHMRGSLVEANTNIVHEEGKYGLTNKRGILLAMANRQTGDLIVRGNVVPYRRTLE